jgi:ABC-type proline/glycine betaine transport system permease subunit
MEQMKKTMTLEVDPIALILCSVPALALLAFGVTWVGKSGQVIIAAYREGYITDTQDWGMALVTIMPGLIAVTFASLLALLPFIKARVTLEEDSA